MPTASHADHVIDLDLAAGTDAKVAMNAGVEVDAHRNVAAVEKWNTGFFDRGEAAFAHPVRFCHVPEMARRVVLHLGLVSNQKLGDKFPRFFSTFGGSLHHHAFRHGTNAGGDERAFTFDFHHAGAAVAVGTIARCRLVAEMRNGQATAMRRFPDRGAFGNGDVRPVEGEGHGGFDHVFHVILPRPRRGFQLPVPPQPVCRTSVPSGLV